MEKSCYEDKAFKTSPSITAFTVSYIFSFICKHPFIKERDYLKLSLS